MNAEDATIPALDTKVTTSESELVNKFDRQRRQRLLTLLGATFGGILGFFLLVLTVLVIITQQFSLTQIVELIAVALSASIFLGVVLLARNGRVEWSSTLFAVGGGILPNINVYSVAASGGNNPFLVVFLLGAIVIVSLAGRPWIVIVTAALSSLTSIYVVNFAPTSTEPAQAALHTYLVAEGNATLPILFVTYWGMTLLLLAQWNSYQRLLLELAEVRVQIQRARQLDELKDQFIRSVNHELRTPIMTLLGYIDLLLMAENRRSPEKVERYLQRAARAGESLRRLLAGILDSRRLNTTQQTLPSERLSVLQVLEEVIPLLPVESNNGVEVERALRVHLSPGVDVWAEPLQFQQILINLMSNAVKYSEPGSPVDIDVHPVVANGTQRQGWFRHSETGKPMVEIVIRDYGLGIPPEMQPLLFQRFMRLPRDLESQVMGTGLGLYLCKSLVERMGGTIRVESTGIPGQGTSFLVRLPIAPVETGVVHEQTPTYVERHTGPLVGDPVL